MDAQAAIRQRAAFMEDCALRVSSYYCTVPCRADGPALLRVLLVSAAPARKKRLLLLLATSSTSSSTLTDNEMLELRMFTRYYMSRRLYYSLQDSMMALTVPMIVMDTHRMVLCCQNKHLMLEAQTLTCSGVARCLAEYPPAALLRLFALRSDRRATSSQPRL